MNTSHPLKRHQAIVSFSHDHHFGLLLVWKIRTGLRCAVDPERISSYVLFFFNRSLLSHFEEEEQMLFSVLPVDDPLRKQAEKEHVEIRGLVTSIEKNKSDVNLLNEFADQLQNHIRFEERVLFEHLQLSNAWGDIEKRLLRVSDGEEPDQTWEDKFWVVRSAQQNRVNTSKDENQ